VAIYETVVILDSLLPAVEIDNTTDRVKQVIEENGGKVRKVEKWGKRRLAYEIRKKQYGFYLAVEFEGPGTLPATLQSEYNFNEGVMRYLTYIYDKHKLQSISENKDIKMVSSMPSDDKPIKKDVVIEKVVTKVVETPVVKEKKDSDNAEEK